MSVIIESGNDYLLAVKQNQPKLHRQLQQNADESRPIDIYTQTEKTRNRITQRQISVFTNLTGINPAWQGISCFVKVERRGWRQNVSYQETHYYITSLSATGQRLASLIRGHWQIENRLHWVKDVVFKEDTLPLAHVQSAINWSTIRSIVINLARRNGYESLTTAQRMLGHDLKGIFSLLE